MYLTHLHTDGLRDGASRRSVERVDTLGTGVEGATLADAVALWAGTLCPEKLPESLVRLGAASGRDAVTLERENGWLVQVEVDRGSELLALLDGADRRFAVELTLALDPPFFGRLREHAVRDPRLVGALGQSPTLTARVGWFLSADGEVARAGLLALRVGQTDFSVTGKDRPHWGPAVLSEVGRRVARVDSAATVQALGARLDAVARGTDPAARQRYRRLAEALNQPPFALGHLELVRVDGQIEPAFGEHLVRARRLGPAARAALALTEAALLGQPDILVVDGCGAGLREPAAARDWVSGLTEGDDATLEQVLFVDGGVA